jgi:hypothetical protein
MCTSHTHNIVFSEQSCDTPNMNTGNSIPKKNYREWEKGFGIGACAFVCKKKQLKRLSVMLPCFTKE